MAKKLLAFFLALSMIFSVCAFNVLADEADAEGDEETMDNTEEVVENSIIIDVASSYYPNDTVTVTGSVTGDITGVIVVIESETEVVYENTITAKKFESSGVTLQLKKATVGAEYTVTVYDFADEETYAEKYFIIKKDSSGSTNSSTNNSTGKVTVWIEGLTGRYIDETTVSLKNVDEATVLGVAEYVLEEEGRAYRLSADKSKIDRIATTATGSTYLRDGYGTSTSSSSSKNFADCEWSYFVNGKASSLSMEDMEVENGDEIVLYFGNPDEVIYPTISIEPDNGISLGDKIEVTVTDQYGEPVKGASVYFYKRNSTTKTGGKTDSDGVYDAKTANASFISTYQGGSVMVSYYQSSSKPILMISVEEDILIERDGTTVAYVTVEGAHKTLLERSKSSKIAEYDLLNFAMQVFDDEGLDYDLNSSKDNFEYIELKSTSGYNNKNGDLTDDSGWYVCVNGTIYTPDDDLEDVDVYTDDEIIFYFGDENTIPVVYYTIDGELETDETVYVYFYADEEKTEPLYRFYVYFTGDDIAKGLNTNSDGKITLPSVEYKGTYTLTWGEQVAVKDDYCPYAVYTEVDLKYTGTAKTTPTTPTTATSADEYECDYCGESVTRVYTVEYKNKELDVCRSCRTEINALNAKEESVNGEEFGVVDDKKDDGDEKSEWVPGDYTGETEDTETYPRSYLYHDPDIDWWAVPYVESAYKYNLMSGTSEGWFEPLRGITRAEFTAVVCRTLGLETDKDYTQKFSDVKPTDWYYSYVMAAQAAGYISGKSDTIFDPNAYITREEIAVLVARIVKSYGTENDVYNFADGSDVSAWARTSVVGVNNSGIMTGDQFGQFLPKDTVNRQTAATIAVRLYEYLYK